jgi:uncharacterized iron-regulated membrane protein
MDFRRFVLVTHRWLGLASSAILAIAGATGVVLLWAGPSTPRLLQRAASRFHESLALGYPGNLVVDAATAIAVAVLAGGIVLWWRRKTIVVRRDAGWWRFCFDLHHAIGFVLFPIMLLLAATAVFMAHVSNTAHPDAWRLARQLHTGHYGIAVEIIYAVGSLGFVAQGVTGLVVWWKPKLKAA